MFCSKHVADTKNCIKTLIWKLCIFWFTLSKYLPLLLSRFSHPPARVHYDMLRKTENFHCDEATESEFIMKQSHSSEERSKIKREVVSLTYTQCCTFVASTVAVLTS
jgi:hypothetical protein